MTCLIEGGYDTARHGGAMQVTITETGGGAHVKTVTLSGTYMPSLNCNGITASNDFGDASAIALGYRSAQSDLIGGFGTGLTSVISVSFDAAGNWQITSDGSGGVTAIAVTLNTAAARYFNDGTASFSGTSLVKKSATKAILRMIPALGGLTDVILPREVNDGLATDIIANDGNSEGMAMPGAAYEWEYVVPLEPGASVWHAQGAGFDATWELFFRLVRNVEPIATSFDDGAVTRISVGRLKADACNFAPEQLADNYYEYANVRHRQWYLGDAV